MPKETKKANAKRRRKKSPLKKLISFAVIIFSCYLFYAASQDVMIMLNLKGEIAAHNADISELTAKKKSLSEQKTKLEDPNYVVRYARDKFLVSKTDEQIFKFPGKKSSDSDE